MNSRKTQAIVLRRTNYGEADRILQVITPDGKRSLIARGVRKEKSRLSGGIELFAICDVVYVEGKGELDVLTSARLVTFFGHILENYDRMQFGYLAIKQVAKASEMVDEPEWYDILAETLGGLDALKVNLELVQTWFYLHYSALLGYELSLWHDSVGKPLTSGCSYRYDATERGLVIEDNGEITTEHIKLLRLIATRPLKTLASIGGIESVLSYCLYVAREHAAI